MYVHWTWKNCYYSSAIDKILEKHDKEQKILIAVLTSQRAICEQIKLGEKII